jgi:hypothetical protein
MKKIKITNKQARLLGISTIKESTDKKPILKVTKEQYNRIFASGLINEALNMVDKTFKQATVNANIQNLKEDNFDISKPNTSIPMSAQKFSSPMYEGATDLKSETKELVKFLYRKSEELSDFWKSKGLSYDKIVDTLKSKGLIIADNGRYTLSKTLGSPEQAMMTLEKELRSLIGDDKGLETEAVEDGSNYAPGTEFSPTSPWNQSAPEYSEPIRPKKIILKVIASNQEIAILKTESDKYYVCYFDNLSKDELKDYAEVEIGADDFDIDGDVIERYINFNLPKLSKGAGINDWENGVDIVKIDDQLKNELLKLYDKDRKITSILGGINEMTSAASSGAFVGPLSGPMIKKDMPIDGMDTPVVKEMTSAGSAGNYQYDANALPGINRDGSFTKAKTPKAFKKTQFAGGGFVKTDDCTKLNNNKTAQNGGCSTGAIDNVVKVKQSKGNIIAPSLNEGMMREALKLQHDKAQNSLIVVSDLEGREGSQETFKNKAVLKQSGFIWSGTNWVIPVDKIDIAKKTLSLVNKAEYLIDTLEDLEAAVEDSAADNKSLLKSRLDQYISDLANATDEKALSAEIRRYLTFFSKFHSYSFYNRMLIYIQRPEATNVASYKLWQSKFRQVKKGAKAITVLAPAGKPEMTQYDDETVELMGQMGVTNRPQITRFRAVNVFDISDTEPIDERGEVPDSPQWWGDNTPSETADILFGAVSEVASDMGINVTQSDAKGGEKGFSAGDHINISSDVSGAGRLSTMIHEIAHELMHWKKSSIYFIDNGEGRQKAELQELQAESVSYVVLKHYGIPVSHHATYLVLWKANKERIQNNLEIISKVSQFLITKIDEQVSGTNK